LGIGEMLGDSFDYTKEAFIGKWVRWIVLIICSIIFPLIMGYSLEMMRGKKPAPEPGNWVKTLIDGILYFIINFVYMIPVWILAFIFILPAIMMAFSGNVTGAIAVGGIGLLITIIVAIILTLIAVIAVVRFAREEKFGEAFNFSEIVAKIKSIGWLNLFIKLLVVEIILGIIYFILFMFSMFSIIGTILIFILAPVFTIFMARYICLIYDSA
jgi:hypothetical protein